MDPCFSGEDLVIKTRKPYTITKQRERWTEEEHNRFLEALKLYGRAWQRIEEHIGTKTAIQIRSHAQKFFTKLEKEASVKGAGNGLDIEIPPPRPKRKPVNPYPRKTCGASVLYLGLKDGKPSDATSTSLSMTFVKETEDLSDGAEKQQNSDQEKDDCIEALNLELVVACSSPTSTNSSITSEATERSSNFRQFFPLVDGSRNQNGSAEFLSAKPMGYRVEEAEEKQLLTDNSRVTLDLCVSPEESSHVEMVHDPIDETSHNCPRHVPVQIHGGSSGNTQKPPVMPFMQSMPNQTARAHGGHTVYNNAAATASENVGDGPRLAIPPPYLNSPFLAPMMNPEDYQSFMQMSSTFSSLILSAVAQNAAMYAAASLASTGWPWFNLGAPLEPSVNSSGFPQSRPMNPTSSMTAIAGATVAAATAWWAANGPLPFCPQYHPGCASSPAAQVAGSQSGNMNGEARGSGADPTLECRQPDAELFNAPNSTLKPPSSSSSSDSEASEAEMLERGLDLAENEEAEESDGSNKYKNKKQLDRSSSGSNTLSSSEIEPDAMEIGVKVNEEKHIKTRENIEEPNAVLPTIDTTSRRSRSSSSPSDPWKEVSDEGRLAFQALFSREVLPQSFSPPHDLKNKNQCSKPVEDGDELTMFKIGENQMKESCSSFDIVKKQDNLLNEELNHTKVKAYRTGFRLYKRCSMEAKETRLPEEHKDPKKLRL